MSGDQLRRARRNTKDKSPETTALPTVGAIADSNAAVP
jgi:hypothetical protein